MATLSLAIVLFKIQGDNKMTDKREVEETISHVCIQRVQATFKVFPSKKLTFTIFDPVHSSKQILSYFSVKETCLRSNFAWTMTFVEFSHDW